MAVELENFDFDPDYLRKSTEKKEISVSGKTVMINTKK